MTKRFIILLATMALATFAVAGCGDSSDGDNKDACEAICDNNDCTEGLEDELGEDFDPDDCANECEDWLNDADCEREAQAMVECLDDTDCDLDGDCIDELEDWVECAIEEIL